MKINEIKAEKILSLTGIDIADYVINPYRGCYYNCLYCYSKNSKYFKRKKELNSIDVKINSPELLKKELEWQKPSRVLIGSTTEVYQPIEKKYRITRKIIRILSDKKISFTILTRSPLIKNDIDIIKFNPGNNVYYTINSFAPEISNILETSSPSVNDRYNVINKLISNQIRTMIHIGPYLPYITEIEDIFLNIRKFSTEINIELYNPVQGQFDKLEKSLKKICPGKISKIKDIYSTQEKYDGYCSYLKQYIIELNKKNNFNINFYFPDYKNHYRFHEFKYIKS